MAIVEIKKESKRNSIKAKKRRASMTLRFSISFSQLRNELGADV